MSVKSFIIGLILFVSMPAGSLSSVSADNNQDWTDKGWRSISTHPSLSIDGNAIYIYSEKQLDNLCVQIKDVSGNIIYSDIITIQPESEYMISLDTIPEGDYQILLTQGTNYLSEDFTKK